LHDRTELLVSRALEAILFANLQRDGVQKKRPEALTRKRLKGVVASRICSFMRKERRKDLEYYCKICSMQEESKDTALENFLAR